MAGSSVDVRESRSLRRAATSGNGSPQALDRTGTPLGATYLVDFKRAVLRVSTFIAERTAF